MKQSVKMTACLLLLLALCACGSYEARAAGTWQGDGSLDLGTGRAGEERAPFEGAERWSFDGDSTAIATVDGRDVTCRYSMTGDTLTLNAGGEVSWGVLYELRGGTLRIGGAEYVRVK